MQAPSLRQFCFYWLPPLLFTGAILVVSGDLGSSRNTQDLLAWLRSWLSFLGPEQIEETGGYLRKAGHVIAYAALCFLWFRAFRVHFSSRLRAIIFCSLSLCLLTALADEGRQSLVASRTGSFLDVALDFGAAALAALALSLKR